MQSSSEIDAPDTRGFGTFNNLDDAIYATRALGEMITCLLETGSDFRPIASGVLILLKQQTDDIEAFRDDLEQWARENHRRHKKARETAEIEQAKGHPQTTEEARLAVKAGVANIIGFADWRRIAKRYGMTDEALTGLLMEFLSAPVMEIAGGFAQGFRAMTDDALVEAGDFEGGTADGAEVNAFNQEFGERVASANLLASR